MQRWLLWWKIVWQLGVSRRMWWIAPRGWLWVRVLLWKLGVLEWGLLILRLLWIQRLLQVREVRKPVEGNIAFRKVIFHPLQFPRCCFSGVLCRQLQGVHSLLSRRRSVRC